jgi:hypothetical protein
MRLIYWILTVLPNRGPLTRIRTCVTSVGVILIYCVEFTFGCGPKLNVIVTLLIKVGKCSIYSLLHFHIRGELSMQLQYLIILFLVQPVRL